MLGALRACGARDRSGAGGSGGRAREELVELGVEPIDEWGVPVNSLERVEAGAVMGELGAVLGLVQLPRWQ